VNERTEFGPTYLTTLPLWTRVKRYYRDLFRWVPRVHGLRIKWGKKYTLDDGEALNFNRGLFSVLLANTFFPFNVSASPLSSSLLTDQTGARTLSATPQSRWAHLSQLLRAAPR
jgi:hypothetical protein